MIRFATFGGCGLHNPLNHLRRLDIGQFPFRRIGFQATPYALSANANLQLLDFVTGETEIPEWIRRLTYGDSSHVPTKEQGERIYDCDIILSEMSTPVEYMFEGFILNINRFEEVMAEELGQLEGERKLIAAWRSALVKGKEEARAETAERLYSLLPRETDDQQKLASFVRGTTSRMLDIDEMTAATGQLRERFGKPMGLVLHNFQFLPDGRPISWPSDFKRQVAEIGSRLDMPTLDLAPIVQKHGVGRAMAADRRHWEPRFYPRLAEGFYDFAADILGRPSMKDKIAAQRVEKRQELNDDFEEEAETTGGDPRSAGTRVHHYEYDFETGGYLPSIDNTIFVIVLVGQSWATGASADATDLLPVTVGSDHEGCALMFDAGIRPAGRPVGKFVDLRESVRGSTRETPCSGIADHILRQCDARFAQKPELLFVSVALAGVTLSGSGLSPDGGSLRGSQQHRQAMHYVNRARQIAEESARRCEVLAICYVGGDVEVGQKGANASEFERQISLLQQQYDVDLRAITRQDEPIRLFVTQTARSASERELSPIAAAQLSVQERNPNVRCAGPLYCFPTEIREKGHPLHGKPLGHRRLGQTLGHFLLEECWGPGRDALRVVRGEWINPAAARLTFSQPIAIETSDAQVRVSDLGPGGGLAFDDGTRWPPSICAIRTIKGHDYDLEVELSSPPTGFTRRFFIAAQSSISGAAGNLLGPRSAIRSRRPFDKDPADGADLYLWACRQEILL